MKKRSEYRNFRDFVDKVLSVPHSEIKAKLDAEKKAKGGRQHKKKAVGGKS
jgi:hypothetical protein